MAVESSKPSKSVKYWFVIHCLKTDITGISRQEQPPPEGGSDAIREAVGRSPGEL